MKWLKTALAIVAGVWLMAIIMVGAGGTWLVRNQDEVATAVMDASGITAEITKAKDARCQIAQERLQLVWDRAVEANALDDQGDVIQQAETEVKLACATK